MKRTKTWEQDFAAWITDVHLNPQPFAWGVTDCCLFVASGVQAITGVDLAADMRGKYDSQASAFALIQSLSGGSTVADMLAYVADGNALTEWPKPLFARRGDLVTIPNEEGELVAGIVSDNGKDVLSMGTDGVTNLSIQKVTRAWKV